MSTRVKLAVAVFGAWGAFGNLSGQMPPMPNPAQAAAIKKFDWWVGEWKGSGWTEMGPGPRHEFTIQETIAPKLGGVVLLIEGIGKSKGPDGKEVTSHHALAVLSYEEKAKQYRMRSHLANGRSGDFELKVLDRGFQWGMQIPQQGEIRYTMKLTEKGEWFEIGERSPDGKIWRKFHEMTLGRVQ